MRFITLLALVALSAASKAEAACTTTPPAVVWSCYELAFESASSYAHPINDVTVSARFTLQGGSREVSVYGFWDGGRTYRIRAALPTAGEWRYNVSTDDPQSNLNGLTGTINVVAYEGTDPYRARGWLKVSENRRYLTYADGTPFFWLADTPWEMGWSSYPEQIVPFIENRRAKGFNVLNVVANSHQMFHPWHVNNRWGEPYLLNEDLSLLNPRYFDHLDTIADEANAAGIALALVPI